jgi:hypothetical protein
MADPAFVRELKSWIRFNGAEAVQKREGLYSATTGNPSVPTWLGELAFGWLFRPKSENDKYARQIRSSAGIAVFIGQPADKAHWIEVGRWYERFALQASALGIRNAFLNQPAEVPSVRPQFAAALGVHSRAIERPRARRRGPLVACRLSILRLLVRHCRLPNLTPAVQSSSWQPATSASAEQGGQPHRRRRSWGVGAQP